MKKHIVLVSAVAAMFLTGCSSINTAQVSSAGLKALQAVTISDAQIQEYTREFIVESDKNNSVAPDNDPYAVRLNKITQSFNNTSGLNIKVYKQKEVNAFATADGSIRVYSGLMDIMTDEEILGVIGHEIGHVMNKDTKNAFKNALLVSAARDGITSTSGRVAALTSSQLGDLGETFFQSQYSQKQEFAADDFGYEFLKSRGLNPWAMPMALDKLKQLEQQAGASNDAINQLFSTHPDIAARSGRIADRATKEGFAKPEQGGSLYITQPATGGNTAPAPVSKITTPVPVTPAAPATPGNWSF